ncbi:tRNA methyltransferase ppm2 [Neocucurbitaria cava]|uniref:tRNA wybutosine-synthesizing protein 4 n=1 Tax=Neocucurbitaria cava TaxID=798079 RepID=A0A9W8Y807_9PLEO|nr:tRNA methyltransferase ppm2 [Neocucurbitaria cava]
MDALTMSTATKMKPKKSVAKRKGGPRTTREKRDVDIMNTNDSSIVSKRSVSKLYFKHEPDFYEPFVPKFVRRNPLINRGYWLRMHAIEQVVRHFLEDENSKSKVVVNLGCGYKKATFVDVDYPQLIEKKRDRMLSSGILRDALLGTKLRTSKPPVYLRSDQYMAIGCDLKELNILESILRAEFDAPGTSFLFVAEVSVTYMPTKDADALIRWASTLEDTRFCVLEQYLPQGPEHPFAQTMLKHFDKLQTSIKAVKQYPSLAQQSSRYLAAGWSQILTARNLWDLWSDDAFTPPAVRRSLDAVEPFDEWEEFALFGGHYFLLVASNAEQGKSTETSNPNAVAADSCMKTTDAEIISMCSWKQSADAALTPRRFTAAHALDGDTIALLGGQGTQARLASVDILRREDSQLPDQPCTTPPPPARVCHTITSIGGTESLLVGGRGSPTQALADCWLIKSGIWKRVEDLPQACYRHCAVAVALEAEDSQEQGVLVFGGKASDGTAIDDCVLWTANNGWHIIPVNGPRPPARFGAAMSTMSSAPSWGLLTGGVGADGTVLEDVWEWTISATPTLCMVFKECTNNVHGSAPNSAYARLGASMVPWGKSFLLIGGVSKNEIHSQSEDFLRLTHNGTGIVVEYPVMQLPSTWSLLVGMGVAEVSPNEVVIAGGGAVCFSMGSFWNESYLTITPADTQGPKPWRVVPQQISTTAHVESKPAEVRRKSQRGKAKQPTSPRVTEISRVQLRSAEDFSQLVARSKPAIIEGLNIGPCVDLWTLDYLKEKLGPERELVIHKCSSDRMTFKDKNFQYVKESVADFLDGIAQGSHAYLRAVSSSQANKLPTKLEDDFPTIASDFHIPEVFDIVKTNSHSSPLRISGPVSLWLHYDVLANVLCQIRGTKTLYLYPPSDVKYLDFPPGGSSSNTDVLTSKDPKLRRTHPHVAFLKPGDILFIPPMWSHTATPEEGVSIAVNVFWRDLDKGYAAGKDVYGNRDLQAYENGRRDVEKIVRAFRDVPPDIARFYLDRLAGEIQEKADKLGVKHEQKEKQGE